MKRSISLLVKGIREIDFNGKIGYQLDLDGALEAPYAIKPIPGNHNYETCEKCQQTLKEQLDILNKKFNGHEDKKGFPDCCDKHANLRQNSAFDRNKYLDAPELTAHKIVFTIQQVVNQIESENWYQLITDYLEWAVTSFGQMPTNCGEPLFRSYYLDAITGWITKTRKIPKAKKQALLSYLKIEGNTEASRKGTKKVPPPVITDMNVLVGTYQRWLKVFPFDLNSYFGGLKAYYARTLPILQETPRTNMYTGVAVAKLHTKESLIQALVKLTDDLLTKINAQTLFESGLITDADKIKLELVIEGRKLKLKQGYSNDSQDEESRYRKILKEWFEDEKNFIDELKPLLRFQPKMPSQYDSPKAPAIALFCFLVKEAMVIEKKETESAKDYCTKVCQHFKLKYTERVRQGLNSSYSKANVAKVKELILPKIDVENRSKIENYLATKQQNKGKLYG